MFPARPDIGYYEPDDKVEVYELIDRGFITKKQLDNIPWQQRRDLFNPFFIQKIINCDLTIKDVIGKIEYEKIRTTENKSRFSTQAKTGGVASSYSSELESDDTSSLIAEEPDTTHHNRVSTSSHLFSASGSAGSSAEGSYSVESSDAISENSGVSNKHVRKRRC
jgi:hypothetical protein